MAVRKVLKVTISFNKNKKQCLPKKHILENKIFAAATFEGL